MVSLTRGFNIECKNRLGGVNKVYLLPFVKYPRSEILIENNVLLELFPNSIILEYETLKSPNVTITNSENDGGKFYDLSITFELLGTFDSYEVQKLAKKDYRVVYTDNNGNNRILGLYKGLYLDNLKSSTGSSKNSLNGLSVSFKGQEETEPFFIDNLIDTGFYPEEFSYLLQEDGGYLLQEDGFKILL